MSRHNKKGKHTSITRDLRQPIAWLETFIEVKRVVIGRSESCRHKYSPGTLRVKSKVPGGIALNAYGGDGISNIYVKIQPIEAVDDIVDIIRKKYDI